MRSKNAVLSALADEDYDRIVGKMEFTKLALGKVLYQSGGLIKKVYFPESGLVSLVRKMKEKVTIEVGIIGNDGMVGIPVALGDNRAFEDTIVQMAGGGMQMSAFDLREELKRDQSSLLALLLSFTRGLMKQVAQTAACNRLHTIEQRLSRWMLMCRDRMESDELLLTQEFISNMLGTRREGVSIAATVLQRQGLINYSRGHINILDRNGLEKFSCECHQAILESARKSSRK